MRGARETARTRPYHHLRAFSRTQGPTGVRFAAVRRAARRFWRTYRVVRRARRAVPPLLLALAALACATMAPAPPEARPEPAPLAQLEVRLSGLASDAGRLACALFDDAARFDASRDPVRRATLEIVDGRAAWTVDVPYGVYAIKAYHDLDGDGELDRNALGIPTEPYGVSNEARRRLGPPAWEDARFTIDAPRRVLEIRLR